MTKMVPSNEPFSPLLRERQRVHTWLFRSELARLTGLSALLLSPFLYGGLLLLSPAWAAAALAVPFLLLLPVSLARARFALYKWRVGSRWEARRDLVQSAGTLVGSCGLSFTLLGPLFGTPLVWAGFACMLATLPLGILEFTQRWWNRRGEDDPELPAPPPEARSGLLEEALRALLRPGSQPEKTGTL